MPPSPPPLAPSESAPRPGADRLARWGFLFLFAIYLFVTVAYAAVTPRGDRFYDERFNYEVVRQFLGGSPAKLRNHWYSPLSWAPQVVVLRSTEWVADATGFEALRIRDPVSRRPRHLAIVLCRLVNVAYAAIALLLLRGIATRLASPTVAFWSALVFVSSPWAIRVAVEFKPDPLLLMTTLLCLAWALPLTRDDGWRGFARVGLACGLSVSAKLNGVLVGPSVALAVLAGGVTRRRLTRAAGAAGIAAATFLLTQPWLRSAISFWRRIQRHYDGKLQAISFFEQLVIPWRELFGRNFLGPLLGALALVGLALLGVRAARGWRTSERAREWAVVVSYPPFYVLGAAALMIYPKSNSLVQLIPFLALAAGWAIDRALGALGTMAGGRGASARRTRWVRWGLGAVVVAIGLNQSLSFAYDVYEEIIPSTASAVRQPARRLLRPLSLVAAVDPTGQGLPRLGGSRHGFVLDGERVRGPLAPVVRFAELNVAADGTIPELELFDAELFAPERLDAWSRAELERHLRSLPPRAVRRIERRWFRRHGEPWILVVRRWIARGPPDCRQLDGPQTELERPAAEGADIVATVVMKVGSTTRPEALRLSLAGRELPLLAAGTDLRGDHPMRLLTSLRFRWPGETAKLAAIDGESLSGASVCVQLWDPPQRGAP